jgi:hypothetical protein
MIFEQLTVTQTRDLNQLPPEVTATRSSTVSVIELNVVLRCDLDDRNQQGSSDMTQS